MSLSHLFLALTLLVFGATGLGWLDWSMDVTYWLAIITAVLLLLEGLRVFSYTLPERRDRA